MPVKGPEVQAQQQAVVVAVTKIKNFLHNAIYRLLLLMFTGVLASQSVNAAVLPEERVDSLYHNYTGGGITIDGPSILVRKNFADKISISANYYVDNITSASIDAITQASPYTENRVQQSIGIDYLNDKSTLSYSYTTSIESDFDATTHSFGISQEMFGSMTTISLGYSIGDNIITKTGDDTFLETSGFTDYRASLSQVLTKNLIMALTYDIITDDGFLNNPYRSIRYLDATNAEFGYSYQLEEYPETRSTNAVSISMRYFLPYRAALYGSYRYFTDSWGIKADTYEIGYVHPLEENWTFETSFRYYSQTQANFYSDLFPFARPQNVFARDKELSTFTDINIALGVTYEFGEDNLFFFDKGSANLYYTYMAFDYANFRDVRVNNGPATAGSEPLYNFTASVIRLYFSFWF
ncbi:FIG01035547: hypothetical protein [hydrothermal vent metagenome]|uniref:DUF3570 domain-containing protein n=1 Tax=hydrothermal vent metagenome TaxID=652676 RepID=A0A3B0XFN2_9ZZZZ